jgi:hypothetical protein
MGGAVHFESPLEDEEEEAEEERRDRGRVEPADLEYGTSPSTARDDGSVYALSEFARTADLRYVVGERRPVFVSINSWSEPES